MKKLLLALGLSLLCLCSGIAQDKWINLDYATTNTGENGLIGGYVYTIYEDNDGKLWFGTSSGISTLLNGEWESITTNEGLQVNEVGDILQDKEGNVWISYGSYVSGVSWYDGTEWHHIKEKDGLVDDKVNAIFKDKDGVLWFATYEGVSKFDGEEWTSYTSEDGLIDEKINSICQDGEGKMWFGTSGKGISIFDGTNWSKIQYPDGQSDNFVDCIIKDSDGNIWTDGHGVNKFDGANWTKYLSDDGLINNYTTTIYEDSGKTIWIGTGSGISAYKSGVFTNYTIDDNLPSNTIFTIFETSSGEIYVGTDDGLGKFKDGSWEKITSDSGLADNDVNDVFRDRNGAVWFCTHEGISSYHNEKWKTYKTALGNEIEWVSSGLEAKSGKLWFGTVHGLFGFDGTEWTYNNFNNSWVRDILELEDGSLLLSSSKGVFEFDPGSGEFSLILSGNWVNSVMIDDEGRRWYCTQEGIIYDGEEGSFKYTTEDGLPSNYVNKLFQTSTGEIWAGTDRGLTKFLNGEWLVKQIYLNGSVTDIYEDANAALWLAGIGGITKFDGITNLFLWTVYDKLGDAASCIYRERTGEFWFGLSSGVVKLIPDIEVKDVVINEKSTKSGGNSLRIITEGITNPFQFSIDNGKTFERNDGIFNNLEEGTYEVLVTNAFDTIRVQNINLYTTAIDEPLPEEEIKIYPNPTQGVFYIETEDSSLEIIDLKGQIVLKDDLHGKSRFRIDISGLARGTYIVRLNRNGAITSRKLVLH